MRNTRPSYNPCSGRTVRYANRMNHFRFTTDVAITEDGALKNDDAVKTAEVTLKAVEEPVGEANMKK